MQAAQQQLTSMQLRRAPGLIDTVHGGVCISAVATELRGAALLPVVAALDARLQGAPKGMFKATQSHLEAPVRLMATIAWRSAWLHPLPAAK